MVGYLAPHLPERLRGGPEPVEEWHGDVRVERYPHAGGRAKVLVLHGGGGHAGLLAPFAVLAHRHGAEAVVPDLPGFGASRARATTYEAWVRAATALAERERDGRELWLVGCSLGGLLAYDVACRVDGVAGLVATCLLEPRRPAVRAAMARHPLLGRFPPAGLRPFDRVEVPMRLLANMRAIANDPELADACARDPRGGGTRVPVRFLRTLLEHAPALPPERFDRCPVVLAHPADDRWTPVELSRPFFDRLAAPKELVMLEGCGHFPVEEPGVAQLEALVARIAAAAAK